MDADSPARVVTELASSETRASSNLAVVVRDVDVIYRVYEDVRPRMRDLVANRFRGRPHRKIHALKAVSLEVSAGEILGVIGSNGSGKSTLLQAIAGLLPVDRGEVYARSQPTILGVSAVLNSTLSGRRNIVIGGLALGLSYDEIQERFDDIVDFAGLRDFIDVPMKAYSTGMRARLHFAIATAKLPEILLIDEVLTVGDQEFRDRSLERVRELQRKAGTVFIVSHNLGEMRSTCTRTIWLSDGEIVADGTPDSVCDAYESRK